MGRVCILGGGGFIGLALARHLAGTGRAVRTFGHASRYPEGLPEGDHRIGDLSDAGAVADAVAGCDAVFHLAGPTDLARVEAEADRQVAAMVRNVRPLLRLGARGAFGRLVFVSSGGTIYGRADRHPTPEDTPHRPISSYGAGNLAVERLLFVHAERHGLDVRVARVANPYGPFQSGRRGQGVVAALLLHGLRGTPFPLMGDGAMVRDYVAVGDVVEALAMLAAHRGAHRVFNVGSGVGLSLRDLIGRVETVLERPIPIDPRPARALDVPVSILDVSRARAELGWAPRTPLDDGLRRTALWLSRTEGACWPPRRLSATHGLE